VAQDIVRPPWKLGGVHSEMNAHIPQSYEAATELEEIAAVPMQIISPRFGTPVIGAVQDTLVGSYRITRPGIEFSRREFMNLMMWNKRFMGVLPKAKAGSSMAPRWTGHQVISQLLPPINMEMPNNRYKDDKSETNMVKIREGEVLQGTFDKSIFSKPSKGIVHVTYNDYGPTATVNLLDSLQTTIEQFLVYNGFSVGISDLVADADTRKRMEEEIQARKKEVEDILLQIHLDLFDNNTGKSNQEEFEAKVFTALNKANSEAGKIGQRSLAEENRMVAMVRAGSKGNEINISQMIACVGQIAIEGRRIGYGFSDRTLPHYKKYDDGAEARGFVESSFIKGLSPQEFFFHAMSGREGLIDTAVKTADTGYIQRQLIKAMEDLTTQFDGTVRDAKMNIIQFHYGEDGINSTKIEAASLGLAKLSDLQIQKEYGMEGVDWSPVFKEGTTIDINPEIISKYVESIKEDRRMLVEEMNHGKMESSLYGPVNLDRAIMNMKVKFGLSKDSQTDLTPSYVLEGIQKIIQRTIPYHRLWCALVRFHCAPHKLILAERFTKIAFDALCEMLILKNWQSWAQPGEQVGILAAQSIGEPATQMSCVSSTWIHTHSKHNYTGEIGSFIDNLLKKYADKVIHIGENSVVLDLPEEISILGVSNDEKTSWKRISQVSRHPVHGGLVTVTTKSGRKTTATLSHSFLKRSAKGIVPVCGSDLKIGDRVPIAKKIPIVENPTQQITEGSTTFTFDKEFGWICGIYLADGFFNGNHVNISKMAPIVEERLATWAQKMNIPFSTTLHKCSYGLSKKNILKSKDLKTFLMGTFGSGSCTKTVGTLVYNAPLEFIQGVVGGFWDGDGNINIERQQIRVRSRNHSLLQHINRLLGYCGIFGVLDSETSKAEPGKIFYCLHVLKKDVRIFKEVVGLRMPEKAVALEQVLQYVERDEKHSLSDLYDKIPAISEILVETGELLKMPGHLRKEESVGRERLKQYIQDFRKMSSLTARVVWQPTIDKIQSNIALLEAAVSSDVVWDEIIDLERKEGNQNEMVYDFTVPGNDSFMVDDSILVHNTLNTFHLAGVAAKSNMTRGVPRLKELLKVTQNPKATSLTVFLKPEFRGKKEKAREVAQDLELTLLHDICTKSAIYFDPIDTQTVLPEDRELIQFYQVFNAQSNPEEGQAISSGGAAGQPVESTPSWSKWLLRLELDREKMFNKNISMDDIAFVLNDIFENQINTVYSDFNSTKLVMRIKLLESDNESTDDFMNLKKFQNKILNSIVIRGVPGIKAVTFRKEEGYVELVNGEYKPVTQYVLDTDGSNFMEVMNHPAVDGSRLLSSHVHDIFENLGVEATRSILLNEMSELFEDAGVNYRHLGLLCDVMTRAGRLMSVDRYGINKNDIGPLAKASFEETEKILKKAAFFGEVDPVTGVSANIMMGQTIRGGTGFSQVLLDETALLRLMQGLPPLPGGAEDTVEADEAELTQDEIDAELYESPEDKCSTAQLKMNIALPPAATLLEEPETTLHILDDE
jgi:DNA-directed RNA polymerase beta' subunit